jgi:hypothetical protein
LFVSFYIGIISIFGIIIFYLITKPANLLSLDTKEFFLGIGCLFTLSSLIVASFGFISYFQSAEGMRRLTELEITLTSNIREMIVMGTLWSLIRNRKIFKVRYDMTTMLSILIHCCNIADSKDLTGRDTDSIDDLVTSFLELAKIGGLSACEEILKIISYMPLQRGDYSICIAEARRFIKIYSGKGLT